VNDFNEFIASIPLRDPQNMTLRHALRIAYPGKKRLPKRRKIRKDARKAKAELRRGLVEMADWCSYQTDDQIRSGAAVLSTPFAIGFGPVSVPRSLRRVLGRWIGGTQ
jgi:hypothetical protein